MRPPSGASSHRSSTGPRRTPRPCGQTGRRAWTCLAEPPAREDTGAHSQLSGGWKAPDPERTTPVEQAAQAARSAPEPHILEARPTEHGQARRMEFAREAEQAPPPGPGYGDPRDPAAIAAPARRLSTADMPTTVGPRLRGARAGP